MREVPVDDEALALDEIRAAGPGGNHLGTEVHAHGTSGRSGRRRCSTRPATTAGRPRARTTLLDRLRARVAELRSEPRAFELADDVKEASRRSSRTSRLIGPKPDRGRVWRPSTGSASRDFLLTGLLLAVQCAQAMSAVLIPWAPERRRACWSAEMAEAPRSPKAARRSAQQRGTAWVRRWTSTLSRCAAPPGGITGAERR